jgi:hypothetical protein
MCALSGSKSFYSSGQRLPVMMRAIGCIPEDGSGLTPPPSSARSNNITPLANSRAVLNGLGTLTARSPGLPTRSREQNLAVQCISAGARQSCDAYKAGGSAVTCGGANATPSLALVPITLTPDLVRPTPTLRLPALRRPAPSGTAPQATPPPPAATPPLILQQRALPAMKRPG